MQLDERSILSYFSGSNSHGKGVKNGRKWQKMAIFLKISPSNRAAEIFRSATAAITQKVFEIEELEKFCENPRNEICSMEA